MKKFMACLPLLTIFSAGFAENIILDNQTTYPLKNQKSKIVVQWAVSANDIQKEDKALVYGLSLDSNSLELISKAGALQLNIPKHAAHFRILVWSKETTQPDLLTNWVDVVPDKIYKLQKEQLIPTILMSGAGC